MADLKKTIAIIFSGVDDLSGPINTMTGKLGGFSANIEAIADPLGDAADDILTMDAALAAMAAGGLLYAFNKSKDYEQATIELQKVMQGSGEITAEMEAQFTSLSREYGIGKVAIVQSNAELAQSGFDVKDGMTVLDTSLKITRASELDLAEANNFLKRTLIGYKVEAEDSIKVGDLWNRTSQVSNTTIGQLAEGFAVCSRQALNFGFSTTETSAALTPMIGVFDSGSEAGIALSMAMTNLLEPTDRGETAIRLLTGATGPLNEEFKSGKEIFEAVAIGLQEVDKQSGNVAVAQIVGKEQAKRVQLAFEEYYNTLDKIGPVSEQYNSLQKEVDLQNNSTVASVDRLIVGFEEFATSLGNQFRAAASEAIDGGVAIENALEDIVNSDTFESIYNTLNDFFMGISDLLYKVAENLPEAFEQVDFSGLLKALGDVGKSVESLFENVDLDTPEGLAAAIQRVVDTLESLAYITVGMINQFKPFAQSILGMVESFNSMDDASKQSSGEILALAKMVTEAGLEIAAAILVIGDYADKLGPTFSMVIKTISGAFDSAVAVWNTLKLIFIKTVEDLLAVSKTFSDVALFGAFSDDVAANQKVLADWRRSVESDLAEAADSAFKNLTGIETNFSDTGKAAGEAKGDVDDYLANLDTVPSHKQTEITAEADQPSIDQAKADVESAAPENLTTKAEVEADKPSIDQAKADVEKGVPSKKNILAELLADKKSISDTKNAIDKIPASKKIEIEMEKLAIDRIKAEAAALDAVLDFTAEINVAEIEADAKKTVAAFDSVASAIDSTSSAAADMFSALAGNIDDMDLLDKLDMKAILAQQMDMQQQAINLQKKLVEAQVEYMNAKAQSFREGEGLINISSDGLEPALEMVMWHIIEKVQLRATEEAAEFLLGLGITG